MMDVRHEGARAAEEARAADQGTMDAAESAGMAREEMMALLAGRSATYGLLSRLYLEEIDQELLDELHGRLYPVETGDARMDRGYLALATFLSNLWAESVSELKVDYARCFLGHGVDGFSAAYPYESVYTSPKRLMMQKARDEVLALFAGQGIARTEAWKEGEDHVALELEFQRSLGDRAIEAVREGDRRRARRLLVTQQTFLRDHLLNWTPMLTADMRLRAQTKLYQGLADLTDGFLAVDEGFLDDMLPLLDGE